MPTLYKTVCSQDWKHRPSHQLYILGSGTEEAMRILMDTDVATWQADDLRNDQENADAEADEEGVERWKVSDVWERMPGSEADNGESNEYRWEMQNDGQPLKGGRKFAGYVEGDSWSICYHIGEPNAQGKVC